MTCTASAKACFRMSLFVSLTAAILLLMRPSGSAQEMQNRQPSGQPLNKTFVLHQHSSRYRPNSQPRISTSSPKRLASPKPHSQTAPSVNPSASFLVAPAYPTGAGPTSVAVGDFNADGILDLAVTNLTGNSVSILLGNGDGSFATHTDYPTGKGPSSVALADVNNDGKLDVIVSDTTDGTISVLNGNGDGTLQTRVSFPAGTSPTSVVAADFNGDGSPDVALINPDSSSSTSGALDILIGNGDATFKAPVSYTVPYPIFVAAADLNGDGNADLVVASNIHPGNPGPEGNSDGLLTVFLGKGDGTFQTGMSNSLGASAPLSVAIADLNGDGKLDLIAPTTEQVTIPGPGSVTILFGNGDGTFSNLSTYASSRPYLNAQAYVVASDFNGDSHTDIAVSSSVGDMVSVFFGNGDGTFRPEMIFGTGPSPSFLAAGDFNGDAQTDLVTADSDGNDVTILLGSTTSMLQGRVEYAVGANPYSVVSGDFNADGKVDVVSVNTYSETGVLLGNGDGSFSPQVEYGSAEAAFDAVTGDFNGDNKLDLAVAGALGVVSILLGNGDGTFMTNVDYTIPNGPQFYAPHALAAADFNGDGFSDLVVAASSQGNSSVHVNLLLNAGDGTFQPAVDLGLAAPSLVAADFNGDGKADLALAGTPVVVLLGSGDGSFQPPIVTTTSGTDLALGDFDGNGTMDLVVLGTASFSVLLGKGDGTFLAPVSYAVALPFSLDVGDLNGDGLPDIVAGDWSINGISLFLNNGDGTFQPGLDFQSGPGSDPATADFNGDGKLDLASAMSVVYSYPPFLEGGFVSILLNGQFALVGVHSSKNPAAPGGSVSFTVQISPANPGPAIATGTVDLFDGSTKIASGSLTSGSIVFSSGALNAGTHSIVARYGGDGTFRPASGGVHQVLATPDFSMTASNASLTPITPGQSAKATLTLDSVGGLRDTISLSCTVSPTPMQAPTCALNPSSLPVGNGSSVHTTLTVTTFAPSPGLASRTSNTLVWVIALISFPVVMVLTGIRKKHSSREGQLVLVVIGFLLCSVASQLGCGGAGPRTTGTSGTPPGTYSIKVVAGSGASQHTTALTLTVN